jgi:NADPH:quinone reductase-like Zn-dependent oxidoreductase
MLQQLTSRLGRRRAVIMFTGLRPDADKAPDLVELAELAASGVLRPPIEREVAFDDVAMAHGIVDTGHKGGSVILRIVPAGVAA